MRQTAGVATAVSRPRADEARLWAVAVCISILANGIILTWISIEAIRSEAIRVAAVPKPPAREQTIKIFPEMFEPVPEEKPASLKPEAVRTSPDQESAEPPASRRFMGERNTRATSDRPATLDDPAMPSQRGREPVNENELETTESKYQDGRLDSPPSKPTPPSAEPAPPAPATPPAPPAEMAKGEKTENPGDFLKTEPAVRDAILDGPNPVEIPVPNAEIREDMKPREEKKVREGTKEGLADKKAEEKPKAMPKPRPAPIDDPAFAGNQSKTAIRGSISRNGRSALDVADTAMGRYQSKISRAVELEWQRNCVKHRDFITPGYLTVRFFVQPSGKVRSVQFVGDLKTGEIQKGFTLNSIRDAPIPEMPSAVRKEMDGDALELIFNFYF